MLDQFWSIVLLPGIPMLKKDIETLEKVQRRFTKRIPGLKNLTYCQRLTRLKLDSLELRRVRLDLMLTYKLVFGLTDLKLSDFFYCAVMPKVGDTRTNFSFQAAVQLQGTTTLLIGLHGFGITCQTIALISLV